MYSSHYYNYYYPHRQEGSSIIEIHHLTFSFQDMDPEMKKKSQTSSHWKHTRSSVTFINLRSKIFVEYQKQSFFTARLTHHHQQQQQKCDSHINLHSVKSIKLSLDTR